MSMQKKKTSANLVPLVPKERPIIKNWFDWPIHPSDDLIHWTVESNLRRGWSAPGDSKAKTFADFVKELRAAWDLLAASPETEAALKLLLSVQRDCDQSDAADEAAGENL